MKYNVGDIVIIRQSLGKVTWGHVTAVYPYVKHQADWNYKYEVILATTGLRDDFEEEELRRCTPRWIYGAHCSCGSDTLKHPGHTYFCDLDINERLWENSKDEPA